MLSAARSSATVRPGAGGHTAEVVDDLNLGQVVPPAGLEVVRVVGGSHLNDARSELWVSQFVGDDGDLAVHQRQLHGPAMEVAVALVLRMDCDGSVAEHGFRPGRRHHNKGRGIVRIEGLALDRIAQVPEVALGLDLHHLEVGDRGQQLGVPVDQPLVLVD